MTKIRRNAAGISFLAALAMTVVPSQSQAINERWYMFHSCEISYDSPSNDENNNWVKNEYGYVNAHATQVMFATCAQPHFVGNNGHDNLSANVLDRNTMLGVTVEFCRNDGSSGSEICSAVDTGAADVGSATLLFSGSTDARSYYYWFVSIPDHDPAGPSGGYSALVSLFFDDN